MEFTKGVEIGTDYTLFENVVLSAKYFRGKDLNPRVVDGKDKVSKLFGRVEFLFRSPPPPTTEIPPETRRYFFAQDCGSPLTSPPPHHVY